MSSCVVALSKHSMWALDVPQDLAANTTAADLANKAGCGSASPDSMAVEPQPQGLPLYMHIYIYIHTYIYIYIYICIQLITFRIWVKNNKNNNYDDLQCMLAWITYGHLNLDELGISL